MLSTRPILCGLSAILLAGAASAAVLRVPIQYATISQALAAASAGDTILVAPGTYPEMIRWPAVDGIRLIAERGPAVTTIDAGGAGRVVEFGSGLTRATLLEGFTLTGGRLNTTRNHGAGIKVDSSPTIRGNEIRGNEGDGPSWNYGGGIHVGAGTPLIERNLIADNVLRNGSWNYGAGIYVDSGAVPEILSNLILRNGNVAGSRGYGAGIFVGGTPAPTIAGNVIWENYNNAGTWNHGGGIRVYSRASAVIVNNTIVANRCSGGNYSSGGGIEYAGDGGEIVNNIIALNDVEGLHFGGSTAPSADHNDLWGNLGSAYSGIAAGPNDLAVDPIFPTPGDFHLAPNSPCMEAGSNSHVLPLLAVDADGDPRLLDGNLDGLAGNGARVDIGADEFSPVRLSASGPPALGSVLTLDTTGPAGAAYALMLGLDPAAQFFDPYGVLLLNPLVFLSVGAVPGADPLPLPPIAALAGMTLRLQSGVISGVIGNATNRVDLMLF